MDVHVGKYHTDNYECGLCERNFENIFSLDIHLQTCEQFKCRLCELIGTSLSDLKKQTKDRHHDENKGGWIYHIKLD